MAHSFSYRAVDSSGVVRSGQIAGASRSAALESIARQGFIPVELREADASPPRAETIGHIRELRLRRRRATPRALYGFTQSLAALLNAGLTIDRALHISAGLAPRGPTRLLCETLLKEVRAGRTLS